MIIIILQMLINLYIIRSFIVRLAMSYRFARLYWFRCLRCTSKYKLNNLLKFLIEGSVWFFFVKECERADGCYTIPLLALKT